MHISLSCIISDPLQSFMFISHYRQHVSITLRVQAIAIFKWPTTIGRGSSSFPHIIASAPSWFVVDDCFLILGFFCYCWSSFRSFGSYLQRVFFSFFFVDCLFSFFLWVVFTRVIICLVLLIDGFLSLIFLCGVFLWFQWVVCLSAFLWPSFLSFVWWF